MLYKVDAHSDDGWITMLHYIKDEIDAILRAQAISSQFDTKTRVRDFGFGPHGNVYNVVVWDSERGRMICGGNL